MTRPEVLPICWFLCVSFVQVGWGGRIGSVGVAEGTHQEDAADVEHKGHHGVEQQQAVAGVGEVGRVEGVRLRPDGDDDVHDGADGGVVVEANERVHFLGVARQQDLDHDEAHGLEDDAADLEQEAGHAEVDLAEAGEGHAADDEQDVEEALERGLLDAPGPRGQEDGHGGGGLEHLDEGDAQIEIDHVAAHQAGAVQQADGHNGAQVGAPRHLDVLAAVEELGRPRQDLGRDGSEDEVPTC
jgi:hypothetical protein